MGKVYPVAARMATFSHSAECENVVGGGWVGGGERRGGTFSIRRFLPQYLPLGSPPTRFSIVERFSVLKRRRMGVNGEMSDGMGGNGVKLGAPPIIPENTVPRNQHFYL